MRSRAPFDRHFRAPRRLNRLRSHHQLTIEFLHGRSDDVEALQPEQHLPNLVDGLANTPLLVLTTRRPAGPRAANVDSYDKRQSLKGEEPDYDQLQLLYQVLREVQRLLGGARKLDRTKWLTAAAFLTLLSLLLLLVGFRLNPNNTWRTILQSLAGALFTIGWIDALHEWFVADRLLQDFDLLAKRAELGIESVYKTHELSSVGTTSLSRTRELRILGIGASWLLSAENREHFDRLLRDGRKIEVLIPDPCSEDIARRYERDEPDTFELGLEGLAQRLRDWDRLAQNHSSLNVRAYDHYPSVVLSSFDDLLIVAPVLYKRRTKDNLSVVYRSGSLAADVFLDHFNKSFYDSPSLANYDFTELNRRFPSSAS